MLPQRLAFVDLETSGLSPAADRITEIGVVTVDGSDIAEWTTLVNPGTRIAERSRLFNGIGDEALGAAPQFKDIAAGLFARLEGRLFVAHNARFDFGFLRAEFERAGFYFGPQVLCSVMLSRKLYPAFAGHDLDTLMQRHGLHAEVRHRALPDARLVWQFWQVIQSGHSPQHIEAVTAALLEGPVLPAHLDPSLIDRLPDAPGVYVLRGGNGAVLHVGKAANLRLHLVGYFRLDRISAKAAAVSHLVHDIDWRVTCGAIGAQLQRSALAETIQPVHAARALRSWEWRPDAYPCVELVDFDGAACHGADLYGLFDSERKARNALLRLATRHHLCHALLGIRDSPAPCTGCIDAGASPCMRKADRLKQLAKALIALRPWRVEKWPYDGPIGVRERSDLHVVDAWRYVGTAHSEHELHQVMEIRAPYFDQDTYAFLAKTLRRLPKKRIVRLPRAADACADHP